MADAPDEGLWKPRDVSRVLNLSLAHVYKMSDDGRLPVRWVLGMRRYVPAEIRALAGLTAPTTDGGEAA